MLCLIFFLARSYLHNLFVQLAFFQLVFPSKSCSFNRQSINWFSAKMHFWQTVLRWKWLWSKGSSAYKFLVKVFRGKCFRSTGFRFKLVEPSNSNKVGFSKLWNFVSCCFIWYDISIPVRVTLFNQYAALVYVMQAYLGVSLYQIFNILDYFCI